MDYKINVGDAIPDFSAKDEEGNELASEDLFGTPTVLYFYPKDDTPGCTKEACSFRDNIERLAQNDVIVIGISPDSAASHQKFIQKHSLNFNLIPDESLNLCKKFDVLKPEGGIIRTTFLVDRDGIVQWIERPVNVEGHVERVIDALKLL